MPATPCAALAKVTSSGPAFAHILAAMYEMSDTDHVACPQEWRDMTALLHTLIEDEGMSCTDAARVVSLPVGTVITYAEAVGI